MIKTRRYALDLSVIDKSNVCLQVLSGCSYGIFQLSKAKIQIPKANFTHLGWELHLGESSEIQQAKVRRIVLPASVIQTYSGFGTDDIQICGFIGKLISYDLYDSHSFS